MGYVLGPSFGAWGNRRWSHDERFLEGLAVSRNYAMRYPKLCSYRCPRWSYMLIYPDYPFPDAELGVTLRQT